MPADSSSMKFAESLKFIDKSCRY